MAILNGMTLLLIYQLMGEALTRWLDWPLPGPVLGMLLMLASLLARGGLVKFVAPAASGLLSHLSLLFIPAGVGVMMHFSRIGDQWMALTIALVLSTLITLAVTAWVMQGLMRLLGLGGHKHD